MKLCNSCPRKCGAVRTESENIGGFCRMPALPKVAKACLHFWEEPFISGKNGSGTIFFSGCSLNCVYCQNSIISSGGFGKVITVQRLSEIFYELENMGAHNINFVNPTHYFSTIKQALSIYRPQIPLVYNSGGFDLPENIGENIFDVYLFDLKYFSNDTALKYSHAKNYTDYAFESIKTAHDMVGAPQFDENGIMKKGVVVRHLILPAHTNDAVNIIKWCKCNVPNAYLSIMSQYIPLANAKSYSEINRKITKREYEKVISFILDNNIENVIVQENSSASTDYIPDFDLQGI